MEMFQYVDSQWNVFAEYPHIDKFLDCKILTVERNYHKRGIATMMIERTIEYVRANNIPILFVMATNTFTAKACQKYNLQRKYQLNFADYFVDGKNPILPAAPHKTLIILVKEF